MNISSALERLYSLQKFGVKLGLDNVYRLLDILGNPQQHVKFLHVAGSNGKGSTSSFMASILMEHGYRTGLYTSPHFIRFNERIRINGQEIPDDYISGFMESIADLPSDLRPTFFEVTTALAFKYFFDNEVDYAVIETGLGGRLDATNTVIPLSATITSISLEHTELLGNSYREIALEKAGIIKNDIIVITGYMPEEAEEAISSVAKDKNCIHYMLKNYVRESTEKNNDAGVDFLSDNFIITDIHTGLTGEFQKYNASMAILTLLKTLGLNDTDKIKKGLFNVKTNTGIQGRYEFYNSAPDIIFDSAHNPEGIGVFLSAFKRNMSSYTRKSVLFGVMKDKKIDEMLALIAANFDDIYITTIDYQRAAETDDIMQVAAELKLFNISIVKDHTAFIDDFRKRKKDECLVVLGSMYVLGKIKEELAGTGKNNA